MCRRELAKDADVVQHVPGKGELAFEPHKRDSVRRGQDTAPVARQKGPSLGLERMQRVLGHGARSSIRLRARRTLSSRSCG